MKYNHIELPNNIAGFECIEVYDYEKTNNTNYDILKKREKQLEKINRRVLQNIQENEQIYGKKIEDMELTLEHNQIKLRSLLKVLLSII
jgi:hypothetical protein